MKHIFKCTWGSIELDVEKNGWNAQTFGECPNNVKTDLMKLKKKNPKPDPVMAHFVIKKICGKTLLYTETR